MGFRHWQQGRWYCLAELLVALLVIRLAVGAACRLGLLRLLRTLCLLPACLPAGLVVFEALAINSRFRRSFEASVCALLVFFLALVAWIVRTMCGLGVGLPRCLGGSMRMLVTLVVAFFVAILIVLVAVVALGQWGWRWRRILLVVAFLVAILIIFMAMMALWQLRGLGLPRRL